MNTNMKMKNQNTKVNTMISLMKNSQHKLKGLVSFLLMLVMMNTVSAVETITYYHNDALGSPVAATDEAGNVKWREEYQPYGERLLKQDGGTNDTWFTGKQEDKSNGLSYFGARWYDPVLGRFTGIDPVGFKTGNIHSFNRYAYANNNPYKYVDPDGRDSVTIGYCRIVCGEIKYQRKFSKDNSTVSEQFSALLAVGKGGGFSMNSEEGLSENAKRGDKFILNQESTASATASLHGMGVDAGGTLISGNALVDPGNASHNAYGKENGGSISGNGLNDSLSLDNGKTGVKPGFSSGVRFSFVTTRPNSASSPPNSSNLAP